jgi:hypothetical protein
VRAGVYPALVGGGGNQTAGTKHSEKAVMLNSQGNNAHKGISRIFSAVLHTSTPTDV